MDNAAMKASTACALAMVGALLWSPAARADGLTDEDVWRYRTSAITVDGGVVAALPAALKTGLAKGFGAGVSVARGPWFWGARAAWATASETTIGWDVTHDDLKLRLIAGAQARRGRGTFGVRLGAGGTLVHERRDRLRGDLAGSTGSMRATTANAVGPAADVDGVVSLHVTRGWMLLVSAGPSWSRVDHQMMMGWNSYLGVAWQL